MLRLNIYQFCRNIQFKNLIKNPLGACYRPMARPGFDALDITAPTLVQLNPQGKWENAKPASLDEDRLRAVVEHLVKSKALSAAQSYCCQCAEENKVIKALFLLIETSTLARKVAKVPCPLGVGLIKKFHIIINTIVKLLPALFKFS